MRSADGKGVVRKEDRHDTDIDCLWSALAGSRRLARWVSLSYKGTAEKIGVLMRMGEAVIEISSRT